MSESIRILVLEDSATDAELLVRSLSRAGYRPDWRRVETERDFVAALEPPPDLILSDHSMPGFDSLAALAVLRGRGLDIPFILVSGTIGESAAVEVMKRGAADFLFKHHLERLGHAVRRALDDRRLRDDRRRQDEELRRTHAQLRHLLSHSPAVLYQLRPEGDAVVPEVISDNVQVVLGFDQEEVLRPDWFREHLHPDDRDRVLADFLKSIGTDRVETGIAGPAEPGSTANRLPGTDAPPSHPERPVPVVDLEFRLRHRDGTWRWLSDHRRSLHDASGRPIEVIGVWTDITEKRLMEARLFRAQRVESIGNLASGIAHDLNNILAPILMCSSLLHSEETPESQRELVRTIEASAQRAVEIVKQLLGYARGREDRRSPLHLQPLIRDIARIARETFPRNIRIEAVEAPDLWPVEADTTRIHQVLLNLCVNARDAMPSGGLLRITAENTVLDERFVRRHPRAHPGPHLRIRVADSGTGIPEDIRNHIFESFFTTKREGEGTGLGLATVQGIVRDHGGFVDFTSRVGEGTTFEVHLPARPDTNPAAAEAVDAPRPGSPRGHGEWILVVDDEPAIREATRRLLETHGYRVVTAPDGIEALVAYTDRQLEIRAVVTDVMMPRMDGISLSRALRRLRPDLPLVVSGGGLFGKAGEEAATSLRELAIRHVLRKPHAPDALLRAIAESLRS